jgi:hypothetical protein
VDFNSLLQAAKEHGPLVALFLYFIWYQTKWINNLLQQNGTIYKAELERMAEVQKLLLTHILGPQPSSGAFPTVDQLKVSRKPEVSQGSTPNENPNSGGKS